MDLSALPAIDQHAHNLLTPEAAVGVPYAAAFTEAHDPEIIARHAPHTLCYRRSLRDVAGLLGCAATEGAVLARRGQLGLEGLTARCLGAAGLRAVLLDDGFLPGKILPLAWHARFLPVRRLLRIEAVAEEVWPAATSFADFLDLFRAAIDPPPPNVVGYKSIAAYRTGLDIRPVPHAAAADRFAALRGAPPGPPFRLADKLLVDFLFLETLGVAARWGLPVQLHTGFGDPDLDLRLADPLHLRGVLEDRRYRGVPLVLLHASYPFTRQAGYLASVYPQVYLDIGLAVPLLSVAGMGRVVGQLLELTPWTKLLYSSDAHFIPELYYLAAKWGREVLGRVLARSVADGDLTAGEADEAARRILAANACALYKLDDV